MEVHSHTHAQPPGHKKRWTHYFWEFLMLFLAVFCGFLAENQREHMVEHRREKEFMVSMLSDLKADTMNLSFMHQTFSKVIDHIDSLSSLLEDDGSMEMNAGQIYQHQVNLNLFFKWIYANRTINQLKNSGSFRLIRKKDVSDAINSYDGYVTNFVGNMQDVYILPQWQSLNATGTSIFKSSVFREYMKEMKDGWKYRPIRLPSPPYFISHEKIEIQKFINLLQQYAVALEWFNTNTAIAENMATKLDSVIRKNYNLKL